MAPMGRPGPVRGAPGPAGWRGADSGARGGARGGRGPGHGQQAARPRHRGPVLIRARAWYCEALVRRTDGNRRSAKIAINTAVRLLDEHRAGMGAADLRAYASGHRGEATTLGLRMALEDG